MSFEISFIAVFIDFISVFSLSGKRLSSIGLISGFVLMSLIGTLMTSLRISDSKELSEIEFTEFLTDTASKLIVNNGGVDIQKLQLLINHVKENEDFRYGEFSTNFLYMAIPRTLWSSKPVNIDTDLRLASTGAVRRFLAENKSEFDPRKFLIPTIEAMREIVKERLEAFGTANQISKIKKIYSLEEMYHRYAKIS